MLTAYFDDSGTHPRSEVVLVGGIFGYPNQLEFLSDLWSKKLADPSPGKPALKQFHMADCQASTGEFTGWGRTATDFLVHELGDIILKTGVWGFAAAVERKPYEELITGNMRRVCGDPETFCFIDCFKRVRQWAREFTADHTIALVFDDRPHKRPDIQKIYETYKCEALGQPGWPDIVSVSFGSSSKLIPLQAADLIAWEFYQDALDTSKGIKIEDGYRRKQLRRLVKGGRLKSEMLQRQGVIEMIQIQQTNGTLIEAMADRIDFK